MGRSPVMLSAAKHLAAQRDRPFAELTLSGANVLRACPERSEGVTGIISKCLSGSSKGISASRKSSKARREEKKGSKEMVVKVLSF